MENTTGCFLIGSNEMDFTVYEKSIRQIGIDSGVYRDLNFIRSGKVAAATIGPA